MVLKRIYVSRSYHIITCSPIGPLNLHVNENDIPQRCIRHEKLELECVLVASNIKIRSMALSSSSAVFVQKQKLDIKIFVAFAYFCNLQVSCAAVCKFCGFIIRLHPWLWPKMEAPSKANSAVKWIKVMALGFLKDLINLLRYRVTIKKMKVKLFMCTCNYITSFCEWNRSRNWNLLN